VVGEGLLRRSLLTGADLSTAVLSPLELRDSQLLDVDLSNARVTSTAMHTVEVVACRGIGLNITIEQASDLYVEDCRFDYATMRIDRAKGPVVSIATRPSRWQTHWPPKPASSSSPSQPSGRSVTAAQPEESLESDWAQWSNLRRSRSS